MNWPNYHHLLYFWTVARLGSIAKASEELMLAPPTISAQLRMLERQMGTKLFRREGRSLVMTETGQLVMRYADSIFALGREMMSAVREQPTDQPLRLLVGVEEAVPKLIARELIRPALNLGRPIRLICREGSDAELLEDLASHRLDVVLSDHPPGANVGARVVSHALGDCAVTFMAAPALAKRLATRFPSSLDGAPALLPTEHTSLRWTLDRWFEAEGVRPNVIAEFDDSALIKVFGGDGMGFFAVHSVIADQISQRYGVTPFGETRERTEHFYAITPERKFKHPAVATIATAARAGLFAR